jgi:hypothetical protein
MLKLYLGIDGGHTERWELFLMTQAAAHGESFIETVGILSRKDFQFHFSLPVLSLSSLAPNNQTDPIPARRLAGNHNLSDGEGSHASCDDHLSRPA